MYAVVKTMVNTCPHLAESDTTSASPDPDPADPWLFTDPAARTYYTFQQRLAELKQDITTYVMHQGEWMLDELELKREVRRLLGEGVLVSNGTFADLSPHPTVYRANRSGILEVSGHRYCLWPADDLVFVPWLYRLTHPGISGPLRVGRLYNSVRLRLCCTIAPRHWRTVQADRVQVSRQTLDLRDAPFATSSLAGEG